MMKPTDVCIKKHLRNSTNVYSSKDARNVRCCNHHKRTSYGWSYNYISFVGRDLDAAKSIGQKLFTELKQNYQSLANKASSKENSTQGFKELKTLSYNV